MSGDFIVSETIGSEPRLSFVPVMVTRLMLSLKKAATPQEDRWSFGELTAHSTMRFAEHRDGGTTRYETHLDTFASTDEGNRNRA